MKRLPSPPVVSAAVSGFVVGVFVTLVASGVLTRVGRTNAAPVLPTPKVVQPNLLWQQVHGIVVRQLGPYTSTKQARLVSLKLARVRSLESLSDPVPHQSTYRTVFIVFRLNDHPLGKSWRLKAAKADVFAVLKALYSSSLPIYDVQLTGRFPLGSTGKQPTTALVVYETHSAASSIPWRRWGREHESVLWNRLPYTYVDPRFG